MNPRVVVTDDQDALACEIEIAVPPARVFEALTNQSELVRWFTGATCPVKFWKMDARKGGTYSYATEKGNSQVNGISVFECQGEILEFDPPRLLVYTWIANWHVDNQRKTVVRWDLTPTAAGTHVKVTHSGLAQEPAARKDYSGGWPGVMEKLKVFAEQRAEKKSGL
ncbi:MAG: SRPBCC domain-containing protein [Terriglobales bacterium]